MPESCNHDPPWWLAQHWLYVVFHNTFGAIMLPRHAESGKGKHTPRGFTAASVETLLAVCLPSGATNLGNIMTVQRLLEAVCFGSIITPPMLHRPWRRRQASKSTE